MNHEVITEVPESEENVPPVEGVSDKVLFDIAWQKGKVERHQDNVQHLTGFYRGKYYRQGVVEKEGD